ncbi:MAG: RNA polymerase sigma factor [Terriglobales bacterium]
MATATGQSVIPADAPAWDALFQAHSRALFRTACRITGSAADAEDVLQTVFLRLLRGGARAAALEQPFAYLRRAAVNAALDVVRARGAGEWAECDDFAAPVPAAADPELRRALRRALARLPPRSAEIFVLRHLEGIANRDIARMLSLSAVHVAVVLHRARRQLQRELHAWNGAHHASR